MEVTAPAKGRSNVRSRKLPWAFLIGGYRPTTGAQDDSTGLAQSLHAGRLFRTLRQQGRGDQAEYSYQDLQKL
jgi:hypothetical protein